MGVWTPNLPCIRMYSALIRPSVFFFRVREFRLQSYRAFFPIGTPSYCRQSTIIIIIVIITFHSSRVVFAPDPRAVVNILNIVPAGRDLSNRIKKPPYCLWRGGVGRFEISAKAIGAWYHIDLLPDDSFTVRVCTLRGHGVLSRAWKTSGFRRHALFNSILFLPLTKFHGKSNLCRLWRLKSSFSFITTWHLPYAFYIVYMTFGIKTREIKIRVKVRNIRISLQYVIWNNLNWKTVLDVCWDKKIIILVRLCWDSEILTIFSKIKTKTKVY